VNPDHPAGLWSTPGFSIARNVVDHLSIHKFPPLSPGVKSDDISARPPLRLAGPLLALALLILIFDNLVILWMGGKLPFGSRRALVSILVLLMTGFAGGIANPARAGDIERFSAIEQTRLAYVTTGNLAVDQMSEAGLSGLSRELYLRTTVEPGTPQAIDLETDDINAVSLLYWPVLEQVSISEAVVTKLNTYMKNGGMLVLDTQDGGLRATTSGGTDPALASLFTRIDIPSLRPVPTDHVLTKAYYLIQAFPGRYAGNKVWVEADRNGFSLDGVSSLVIGANDWAAAWAINDNGKPLAGLSGEVDNQREMARRFGINLVMYVLAGNYKADQVHIPALLERLEK